MEIIGITSEKQRFEDFLNIPDNINIIFSGKFGIGKTYFLKEYFNVNKDYLPIFISPVQYVVLNNKDIFEYIKFYILFELMKNGIQFDNQDLSIKKILDPFMNEDLIDSIIKGFITIEKGIRDSSIIESLIKIKIGRAHV